MKAPFNMLSKYVLPVLSCVAVTAFLLSYTTKANCGWLDKAFDMLKSPAATTVQKSLTPEEIGNGLKEALRVGSASVVSQLGQKDGFNLDKVIHIPLPEKFDTVRSLLLNIGMASMLDDLELKLNRAAEVATPKAKKLFVQAISEMAFEDVMNIYNGPEDAATRYFQDKMTLPLAREMQPVVEQSLAEVGAVQAYENVMGEYQAIPFVPDVKADLTTYVIEKGMEGIFHYMAKEEASIRQNPAKRTTELLQRVFGAK